MNLKKTEFFFHSILKTSSELLNPPTKFSEYLKAFSQVSNVYQLRNFISTFRKFLSNSESIDPEDPFLYEIMKGLIHEIFYGSQLEIKGSLAGVITLITSCSSALKSKFSMIYLEEALENINRECARIHINNDLDFDQESRCLKIFCHILELYEDFGCELDKEIIKKLLNYHLDFLDQVEKILTMRKLYLLKHLDLLVEDLRNIYAIFMNFQRKEFFAYENHQPEFDKLQEKLNNFYKFASFVSKDVLCQIAVLTVFFELRIKKVISKKRKKITKN